MMLPFNKQLTSYFWLVLWTSSSICYFVNGFSIASTTTTTRHTIELTNSQQQRCHYRQRQQRLHRCYMLGLLKKKKNDEQESSSKRNNNGQLKLESTNNVAGIELLQISNNNQGISYVPSGLTSKQYNTLKEEERDKLAKMNFGAFGPRFKRTGVPIGDWMIVPSLWTNGFDARSSRSSSSSNGNSATNNPRKQWINAVKSIIKQYLPSFILGYVLLQLCFSSFSLTRAFVSPPSSSSVITYRKAYKKLFNILLVQHFETLTMTKRLLSILLFKIGITSIFTPYIDGIYLEYMNRKHLWSRQKTVLATIAGGMSLLLLWTTLIATLIK